jgi:hypothetical protein
MTSQASETPKTKSPRDKCLPLTLTTDLLRHIDDWRFANCIGTRAGAIRRLMEIALAADAETQ